jgi:hypothetical protein
MNNSRKGVLDGRFWTRTSVEIFVTWLGRYATMMPMIMAPATVSSRFSKRPRAAAP